MSLIGYPDYQLGVAAGQIKLADQTTGTPPLSIGIPPNVESLILTASSLGAFTDPTITGAVTGVTYPLVQIASSLARFANKAIWYIPIVSAVDTQVTLTWATPPTGWDLVGDIGIRQVVDPVLANLILAGGSGTPGGAVPVGGTDKSNFRIFETDSNGRLIPFLATTYLSAVNIANGGNAFTVPVGHRWAVFQIWAKAAAQDTAIINNVGLAFINFANQYNPGGLIGPVEVPAGTYTYGAVNVNQNCSFLVLYAEIPN